MDKLKYFFKNIHEHSTNIFLVYLVLDITQSIVDKSYISTCISGILFVLLCVFSFLLHRKKQKQKKEMEKE